MNTLRNRIAWRIANFALCHIGTADYRDTLDALVRRGMADVDAGRLHTFEDVFGEPL